MTTQPLREKILATIVEKSMLKQRVFDNTFAVFNLLKDTLFEMASEMEDSLEGKVDRRVRLEYRDRGKHEAQLQIASDLLIFKMHTDIFQFDNNHIIWQNSYAQEDRANCYCGMIEIYDFLSDSFKDKRSADEGYLIGRIFINRERLIAILEAAIYYAVNFDLLTPPYEQCKRVTVDQFNNKFDSSTFVTGKRLNYEFNVDDI